MDNFFAGRIKLLTAGTISVVCCILMVIFSDMALLSARKGISLWMQDVFPALLPFFICANFLQNIGAIRLLKAGTFPFAMSVLSGYPMGAKIVGDLKREGEISHNEAKRLMSFCSTSGPAFMAGAVGAGMLGSEKLGILIAISHYAGAIMNGMIYTRLLGKDDCAPAHSTALRRAGLQSSFTDAILMSFRSLGIILAYIVLFMVLTDMLDISGILSAVEREETRALIKGFLEMTVGCEAVSECAVAEREKVILCSAIMSWGGLSVMGQTMSMLSGTGVSFGFIFVSKMTHGLFSALTSFVITAFVV